MMEIKQKGNRYYRWSRMQFRSFPIAKAEALAKIENGEAILVDWFITDGMPKEAEATEGEQVAPADNVVDFMARKQAKNADIEFNNAIEQFKTEVLPHLNIEDMRKLSEVAERGEDFAGEIMRIMMRVRLDALKK